MMTDEQNVKAGPRSPMAKPWFQWLMIALVAVLVIYAVVWDIPAAMRPKACIQWAQEDRANVAKLCDWYRANTSEALWGLNMSTVDLTTEGELK